MKRSPIDPAGLGVAAEDLLAAVLEAAAQPILVLDDRHRVLFASDRAAEALRHAGVDELLASPHVSVPIGGGAAVVALIDADSHERDAMQASLRRVATLVAGGAASEEVFAAIAQEVASLLDVPFVELSRYEPDGTVSVIGAWADRPTPFEAGTQWPLDGPTISKRVKETGRPVRIEAYGDMPGAIADAAREFGIASAAGAPLIVDGQVWGVMATCLWEGPPPAGIEDRVAEYAALIAAAFSNTATRDEYTRLADEQAALRRVATLVARGVPPTELFSAVAREVGRLLGVAAAHIARYEADGTVTAIAAWSATGKHVPPGTRVELEGETVAGHVLRSGRPARMLGYERASGDVAVRVRSLGLSSSVGAPIVVDQRLWGVMIASAKADARLPVDAEPRIAAFTELVATAISNSEARTELGRLADEQAALRRVATLVAQGVPSHELFGAVAEEAGCLLGAHLAGMIRFLSEDSLEAVAAWAADGAHPPVTGTWSLEGDRLATAMLTTGLPARLDEWEDVPGPIAAFVRETLGIRSTAGSPIIVEGRVWGALVVHSRTEPLPAGTDARLTKFTELVGTSMSNAQARAEVDRLAGEQAALRRVATLVARGSSPAEVFAAVAEEVGRLLRVDGGTLYRFEADETATVVADWGQDESLLPVGTRIALGGENVATRVRDSGRSARIDDYAAASGAIGEHAARLGVRSGVGSPVVVDGRLWGAVVAVSRRAEPLPVDIEARIWEFTELVATAISNIEARVDLASSRARIVAAADDERRRVARDLHDGAQQRLVHTMITLKLARHALEAGPAADLVDEALEQAERANVELRELVHGLLPAVLSHGGLAAGIDALASRMTVPVESDVAVERLPAAVEATAYYFVAESLTNVAKHAQATRAIVRVRLDGDRLLIQVCDDGVGGARPDGTGLVGLADRLAAFEGRLWVRSPAGGGTLVEAELPLPAGERAEYRGWDSR